MKSPLFIVLFFCFNFSLGYAQTSINDSIFNKGNLDSQFDFVFKKSGNYQEYKVVKKKYLTTLKAHALDSLKTLKDSLNNIHTTIFKQTTQITHLNNQLTHTSTELEQAISQKNKIKFLGIPLNKGLYNLLLWSIISVLLGLLILFIYKYNNSHLVTKQAQQTLLEIEEEFEDHRKKAVEREQKVRRQLIDEINKNKKNKP